ncbi:MAG: Trimeric GatFAB AmidoTransferase(AdT) complex subunit, partial [Chaenotheca gracillima]
ISRLDHLLQNPPTTSTPVKMTSLTRKVSFAEEVTAARYPSAFSPPAKKPKMSISQTYYLAHSARGKLSSQAARPDHDLRLLVGHANLLDSLMLELADAEREQEQWFTQTVKGSNSDAADAHVQWDDTTVVQAPEDDWAIDDAASDSSSDSDSDSESESDDDDVEMATAIPLARSPKSKSTPTITVSAISTPSDTEMGSDSDSDSDDVYDDDSESGDLALVRTSSHQPPELLHDSSTSEDESESEEDAMPPSPPNTALEFSQRQRQGIATTTFYEKSTKSAAVVASSSASSPETSPTSSFFEEGFYLPQRSSEPAQAQAIAAY